MLNWKKLSAAVPGLLLLGVLAMNAGCRSDAYYQDRAVQRAREYLLENAPELTAEQLYFVKYNRPLLLTGDILPAAVGPGTATGDLRQICVTWRIPGRVDDYLVYGASSGSMQYWYPNRLIRKMFRKFSLPIDSAMTQARAYSQNYLYGQLGVAEFNRVRFDFPYVIETTFAPVFNPSGSLDPEEVEELKAALEAKTQLSLVWKAGDTGECVVFCGYGQGDLTGWAINFGGKMRQSEVDAVTVRVLKTPDNAQTPIEPPEKTDGEEPGTPLVPEPVVKPPAEQKEAGSDA